MTERRWRGTIDVPLTPKGLGAAYALGERLRLAGGLTICYHDALSRDADTARAVCDVTALDPGPRPWKMGPVFEGNPITRNSILHANWFAFHPDVAPHGGEPFGKWYSEWIDWLAKLPSDYGTTNCDRYPKWLRGNLPTDGKIGIITHNRNLQALYATTETGFDPKLYDADGPEFLSVHYYKGGKIRPWDGDVLFPGVWLIRHGETAFGT